MVKFVFVAWVLIACLTVTPSTWAQDTRAQTIEQLIEERSRNLQPPQREKGDQWINRLEHIFMSEPPALRPAFGEFRQGAGFPFGVAFTMPAMRTGSWRTEAAWSANNFKQGHTMLEFPPLAGGHVSIVGDAKWNDAPDLSFFGVSNFSAHGSETRYGLRWAETGLQINTYTYRWLRFGAGATFVGTHSDKKRGSVFGDENLSGAGARVDLIDARASAAIDTRESAGYTRRGGFYGVTFHRYRDPNGRYSFNRTELDARQFFPILHENWILALQGRADVTKAAGDQAVPYFMLPYVGGRDTLPGYDAYRFTDRNSLLLRSELRWTASPVLDMAIFLDEGKVASRVEDLDLHHLHKDIGVGARIHGPSFTALRLEIAHGVEGWHLTAAHSISF